LDLFSGAGGLTRGLLDAGFTVLGAVEVDALAADSYAANFPEVVLGRQDIRDLKASEFITRLQLRPGELDVLAGCPPCEGFSRMRTLNGSRSQRDERNDLVLEIVRFVRTMRPKTVLVENVPALANDERLQIVRRRLGALGYKSRCDVVDASDYGVPQRRRRMILVASRLGPLPPNPPKQRTVTVREAIGNLSPAGRSGDPLHDHGEVRSASIRRLVSRIPKDGGSRGDLPVSDQLDCHLACDGFKDVYGRMAWDKVAPTITGGCINPSKGRFLHPDADRAITLREAALLQSFPVDHCFSLASGKYAAAELIGNALPPRLVALQARELRAHLGWADAVPNDV
jgi:DNA (cytosine-5)-methyltransferase 1